MDIKFANWDEINVGDKASHSKTITETDITLFAGISGDFNPLHVNDAYAQTTQFGRRVAHGGLSFSIISGLLGMKLPGPGTMHVSQKLDFRKPVFASDTLTARAEVIEKFTKKEGTLKFLRIKTDVYNQDDILVTEGEALVIIL
ncbi:MAG TPA: MaoC family dehydratase [Candidatus Lokiarchaeia archaeon]|nr:MaoC family dehydratase [Candidatus Lokiarchaeia archaeon]